MFICAESPVFSAGHPSTIAGALRAARLLASSTSFIMSTIGTIQLSLSKWGFTTPAGGAGIPYFPHPYYTEVVDGAATASYRATITFRTRLTPDAFSRQK